MNERRRLVLAYGIATWQSTLDAMDAMRRVGEAVPWILTGRIQSELVDLVWEWPTVDGSVPPEEEVVRVVEEARDYLADRSDELSELLSEYGVGE